GSMTAPDSVCAPGSGAFSSTHTDSVRPALRARCARRMAAASPAGPAPTTSTSNSMRSRSMASSDNARGECNVGRGGCTARSTRGSFRSTGTRRCIPPAGPDGGQDMENIGPRMRRAHSALLVVDVQQRLAPAIEDGRSVVANCVWLMRLAERLGVPTVVTEHCPDKIGHSLDAVLEAAAGVQVVHKRRFSALADGCLGGTAVAGREDVIVCGTEAHVCVQQTALDLAHAGK